MYPLPSCVCGHSLPTGKGIRAMVFDNRHRPANEAAESDRQPERFFLGAARNSNCDPSWSGMNVASQIRRLC